VKFVKKFFLSVFVLVLLPTMPAQAEQPIYGEMDLEFNLLWAGPSPSVPEWVGTVTIDGNEHGMVFFNIGTGKPFAIPAQGNAFFFGEIWVIYDWITFDFGTGAFAHGDELLWGHDSGVVTVNDKYRMNGNVEAAFGIYEGLGGRTVHMSGLIEWYPFGAPQYAPGTFRIN
jgi:hypothetical protein